MPRPRALAPTAALLSLALLWAGGNPSAALDRHALRLYLGFEHSLQPALCSGHVQVQVTGGPEADLAFVPGRRGVGLRVKAGMGVNYTAAQVFSAREGTIACWVMPAGWHKGDQQNHYFVRICSATVAFLLYKFYPGNTWVYLEGGGKTDVVGGWWDEWEPGKWTFLAFSFKPGEQAFYINGQLQSRKTENLLEPEFANSGVIQVQDAQVIDELMVFDRALKEEEVRAVYCANR